MNPSRRKMLGYALGLPAAAWLTNFRSLAAAQTRQVKITKIKGMGTNIAANCLIRIETDAGLVGYGEAGLPAAACRPRIDMLSNLLIGQDPLAIERHFYAMSSTQDAGFVANIPTVSGIDIALWDLAGKILGAPVYKLIGGPFRTQIPVYTDAAPGLNWLDKGAVKAWADKQKAAPEKFTTFKVDYNGEADGKSASASGLRAGGFAPTLDRPTFNRMAKAYAMVREALGDDYDISAHALGQYDVRSAIGLCRAIEPINPIWIEDPLTVHYSEDWLALKRATRVPLLQGEKVEMVDGFKPYLDNQVLDIIQPDPSYAGGITGCRKIADYAQLTRVPVSFHTGQASLILYYACMHLGAATQNFFKVENALDPFRSDKSQMLQGPPPVVRDAVFPLPQGNGLGLDLNEDWLRTHVAKNETWWG